MGHMVSVIVPCYQAERFLERCIESLINQTYKDMEIILVDDGSEDGTLQIILEYACKDNRIKCIQQANGGVSKARNAGLKKATGKYICFCDSDDAMEKSAIYTLVNIAEKNAGAMPFCSFINIYTDGTNASTHFAEKEFDIKRVEDKSYFLVNTFLKYKIGFEIYNKLYLNDIIQKYDIEFSENICYAEDTIFNLQYMVHIEKVVGTSLDLYLRFIHNDSLSSLWGGAPHFCEQVDAGIKLERIYLSTDSIYKKYFHYIFLEMLNDSLLRITRFTDFKRYFNELNSVEKSFVRRMYRMVLMNPCLTLRVVGKSKGVKLIGKSILVQTW